MHRMRLGGAANKFAAANPIWTSQLRWPRKKTRSLILRLQLAAGRIPAARLHCICHSLCVFDALIFQHNLLASLSNTKFGSNTKHPRAKLWQAGSGQRHLKLRPADWASGLASFTHSMLKILCPTSFSFRVIHIYSHTHVTSLFSMPHSQCTFHRRWALERLELQALTVPYCARACLKSEILQVWWYGTSFFACLHFDCPLTALLHVSRKFQQQVPQPFENPQRCRQNWREHLLVFIMRSGGWTIETVRALISLFLAMQCNMMFVSCKIYGLLFLVIRADMHSWHVIVFRAALLLDLFLLVWFLSFLDVLGLVTGLDCFVGFMTWLAGMLFPSGSVSVSRTLAARLCRIGTNPNSGLIFDQLNFLRASS